MIGIEIDFDGTQLMSGVQWDASVAATAALLRKL